MPLRPYKFLNITEILAVRAAAVETLALHITGGSTGQTSFQGEANYSPDDIIQECDYELYLRDPVTYPLDALVKVTRATVRQGSPV